jgi:hypothetical protein
MNVRPTRETFLGAPFVGRPEALGCASADPARFAFLGLPLFLVLLETGKQACWRSGFGLGWLFGQGFLQQRVLRE